MCGGAYKHLQPHRRRIHGLSVTKRRGGSGAEPCPFCGKHPLHLAYHLRNEHDIYQRGPRAEEGKARLAEAERLQRQQAQAAHARAAKAEKASELVHVPTEAPQPDQPHLNGSSGAGTFKLMPFVVLEDHDGGVWLAERIR